MVFAFSDGRRRWLVIFTLPVIAPIAQTITTTSGGSRVSVDEARGVRDSAAQGGRAPKRGTHNNRARNLVRSAQMDPDEESQSGAEGEEANTLQRDRDTDASGLTPTGLSAAPEAAGTSKAEGSKEQGRAVAGAMGRLC